MIRGAMIRGAMIRGAMIRGAHSRDPRLKRPLRPRRGRYSLIFARYLLFSFGPVFLGAMAFFVLLLELIDLFANLWRYLALDVSASAIARVSLLYLPTCISYALPAALLFATAYALGSLYSRNELAAVFGSGTSLAAFVSPLLLASALLSLASFFFADRVALPSFREKARYSRELLGQGQSRSNADVALIAREGRVVYRADYYDDASMVLSGLTVVERSGSGEPLARTDAVSARWDGAKWVLSRVRRFERRDDGFWVGASYGSYSEASIDEPPAAFRSQNHDVAEMSVDELAVYASFLARSGLPRAEVEAERHKRYAFSFAPLVVAFLSSALGGRFRKNVLLMSLLSSLAAATGYYVTQMVTMLMAKTGFLPAALGAWAPLCIFAVAGAALFRHART